MNAPHAVSIAEKVAFWTGKRVRSCKIGRKKEFDGVVVGKHPGHADHFALIVKADRGGTRWHRTPSELTILEDEEVA